MEHNLSLTAKKIWNIVRVVYYILRKEMSKRRIMADLNMMMKRGKIAGKAISNLMFPHHHATHSHDSHSSSSVSGPLEYEFSCNNSPAFPHYFPNFHSNKRKSNRLNHHFHNLFMCAHPPQTQDDEDAVGPLNFDKAIMKMLNDQKEAVEASPLLPGFGRTPLVRPLRITDSPFPLQGEDDDHEHGVDKAAEEFIENFYKLLRQQKGMDG